MSQAFSNLHNFVTQVLLPFYRLENSEGDQCPGKEKTQVILSALCLTPNPVLCDSLPGCQKFPLGKKAQRTSMKCLKRTHLLKKDLGWQRDRKRRFNFWFCKETESRSCRVEHLESRSTIYSPWGFEQDPQPSLALCPHPLTWD